MKAKSVIIFGLLALNFGWICADNGAQNGKDYRHISRNELGLDSFSDPGVKHFSELLFDLSKYQMIVGARDTIYKLSLDMKQLEKANWEANIQSVTLCKAKGRSEDACHNFVKVLVSVQNRLFVCATHAYDPKCSWRNMEDINSVSEWIDGRGKCPFAPDSNSTALMTSKGDYYTASSIDFSNSDHAIFRMSGQGFKNLLRTNRHNTLWLSQPDFVGSFETTKFIYFVFRELAMETSQCGQVVRSRIARVCKEDQGGRVVGKDNWTTFLKATLDCSLPGSKPFTFEEVQSMQYLTEEQILYATFTTPESSIAGTAICSFNMSSIDEAFSSKFLVSSGADSVWKSQGNDHSTFECKRSDYNQQPVTSNEYQLVSDRVKSTTNGPIHHVRFSSFKKP